MYSTLSKIRSYIAKFRNKSIGLSKYLVAILAAKVTKKEDIWLISERGVDARDNGYIFFQYLKEKHPEIIAKYVIDVKSSDYVRLTKHSIDIIPRDSFLHYYYIAKSTRLISTHIGGYFPDEKYWIHSLGKNVNRKKKTVFLQHGIIKDDIPFLYYENTGLDLFICGAKYEYDFVSSAFHYPENVVNYTGLCRYDRLNEYTYKNQILLMPTWRRYLDFDNFENSSYYLHYCELLQSEALIALLKNNNLELVFYPHYEVQKFVNLFKKFEIQDTIIVADFKYDVQTLLKESRLLITDYSSVYFDMIYMGKPVLLYQFDELEYRKGHYAEGYFDVSNIGRKSNNLNKLLKDLEFYVLNNYQTEIQYNTYIEGMFQLRDSNNCKRVFESIMSLDID